MSDLPRFKRRLKQLEQKLVRALDRGLGRWAMLANNQAKAKLSGSNASPAGSYPVPVRTGQLRRSQDYVLPGRTKHGISAGHGQAYLVNLARYARRINQDRPFMRDGITQTRSQGMDAISKSVRQALMGGEVRG